MRIPVAVFKLARRGIRGTVLLWQMFMVREIGRNWFLEAMGTLGDGKVRVQALVQ